MSATQVERCWSCYVTYAAAPTFECRNPSHVDTPAARPVPDVITTETIEPPMGSVLMREGLGGTAYQRMWSDGTWRSVTGHAVDWSYFAARARTRAAVTRAKSPDFVILYGG